MIAFLILTSLVLGLWILRLPWYISVLLGVIAFAYALFRFKKKGFVVLLSFLSIGALVSLLDSVIPAEREEYVGIIISSSENYFLFQSGSTKYYISEKSNSRENGDILRVDGQQQKIAFPSYESRFDFASFLANKGIKYEIKVSAVEVIFANPLRMNERQDRFLANFDEETATLIDALLFSRKNYEAEIIRQADSLNIIFLFSLCGVYLRILMSFVEYLFRLKFSDNRARLFAIIILSPLYLLSFEKVAVHRIFLAYGGRIVNERLGPKKIHYATLVALIGLLFLLFDFHLAYQLSFLMGFGLSFLIMFLKVATNVFHRKKRFIIMALGLFLFMLPIHVMMSQKIHLFQIIFQYIAMPLNFVYFVISAISFYTFPMIKVFSFLTHVLTNVYDFLGTIDVTIIVGEVFAGLYVVYYALYFYLPYLIESHRFQTAKVVGLSLSATFLLACLPLPNILSESIHFINVGQGDAILIQSQTSNILIDTGGSQYFDMATEVLIPFLYKRKATRIDLLITTHSDFDHDGASKSLKDNFRVNKHVTSPSSFPLKIGNVYLENLNNIYHQDDNDNSLVLFFSMLGAKWLLMGDASIVVEREIIKQNPNLDVDYIKIGHHGSKTSTSSDFIKKLSPDQAIISVGTNNYYGHPHSSVLDILKRHMVVVRRTDYEGTISYDGPAF